jgi:hypothetical protein
MLKIRDGNPGRIASSGRKNGFLGMKKEAGLRGGTGSSRKVLRG